MNSQRHASPRRWVRAVAVSLLPVMLLAGCYTHVPLQGRDPAPSTRVVVRLTPAGTEEMARQVGPRVVSIEGDVTAVREGGVQVLARGTTDQAGSTTIWNGEQVEIPRAAIAGMDTRTLSRSRSVLIAGAIVAAALIVASAFGLTGSSDNGPGTTPVPPA